MRTLLIACVYLLALSTLHCVDQDEHPDAVDASVDAPQNIPCEWLFGKPAKNTGLSNSRCKPYCYCKSLAFRPPEYTAKDVAFLKSTHLLNPPKELTDDPYKHPEAHKAEANRFCGMLTDRTTPTNYTLKTYDSREAVRAAGAVITHFGACGLCSSLKDLAVYMGQPDLSGPVRDCALKGIISGEEASVKCLMEIGFTHACAKIWYDDSKHTRENCPICFKMLTARYQKADGSLNACIQCDEDSSGPVFKAVAGRTRRNSGLPSALCRPCAEVAPVKHRHVGPKTKN